MDTIASTIYYITTNYIKFSFCGSMNNKRNVSYSTWLMEMD